MKLRGKRQRSTPDLRQEEVTFAKTVAHLHLPALISIPNSCPDLFKIFPNLNQIYEVRINILWTVSFHLSCFHRYGAYSVLLLVFVMFYSDQ